MVYPNNVISFSYEKDRSTDKCYSMNESEKKKKCSDEETSHERPHIVGFYSYKMLRFDKSLEINSIFVFA